MNFIPSFDKCIIKNLYIKNTGDHLRRQSFRRWTMNISSLFIDLTEPGLSNLIVQVGIQNESDYGDVFPLVLNYISR